MPSSSVRYGCHSRLPSMDTYPKIIPGWVFSLLRGSISAGLSKHYVYCMLLMPGGLGALFTECPSIPPSAELAEQRYAWQVSRLRMIRSSLPVKKYCMSLNETSCIPHTTEPYWSRIHITLHEDVVSRSSYQPRDNVPNCLYCLLQYSTTNQT